MRAATERVLNLAFVLLLTGSYCLAQTGYNYARPEVATPAAASSSALRPIVPIGNTAGTATAASAPTYPTAASVYGGNANINTATAVGAQPFGAYNPATAAFTGSTAAGLAKRPVLPQRSSTAGIYAGGQSQFASTARGAATSSNNNNALDSDYDGDYSAIPGVPAVDYPVYAQVPQTNFDCAQQLPGYYADVEAQCQVFHICALNRTYSFLCPNGTVFSQETLVCVWWNQFDCGSAPSLYANNAYIYDYSKEGLAGGAGTTQIGIGGAGRTPTNYAAAAAAGSGGRSAVSTLPTAGIYGAGNLRANAFAAVPTAVSGLATANYGAADNSGVGRFMPGASTQTYNAANSAVTPAPFGSAVIRGGGGGGGGGGATGGGGGANVFPNTQISTTSTNREYLPPRRT